jgi:protein-disulfide isomerase
MTSASSTAVGSKPLVHLGYWSRSYLLRHMLLPALVTCSLAPDIWAQSRKNTTGDISALRGELDSIQADLKIVKEQLAQVLRILNQRQAPAVAAPSGPVRASLADGPVLGRSDAPVTIVEFSDYQCPFCQRFFATTLPVLKKDYIQTGKVRYVFRDFPLDQLHPHARKAAEAAHCAGDQGKFWEMHDKLFENAKALAPPQLIDYARALDLDERKFDECLSSGRHSRRVERGLTDGAATGVRGTPGFVIGKTIPGDTVEGTSIRGAQSLQTFRRIIDSLLGVTQPG